MPFLREIFGSHPMDLIFEILSSFLKVPSGLVKSHKISPLKPVISAIKFANSLIDISFPVPAFR